MDGQTRAWPFANLKGKQYIPRKKLTRDQAALIWQLQTEIRAAQLRIERVLDEAGYSECRNTRSEVRSDVKLSRGLISNAKDAP